jgi:YaiO family outer membrane protein
MKNQMRITTAFIPVSLFILLQLNVNLASAQQDSLQNTLTLSYDRTHFDKQFAQDWQVTSLEYKRQTVLGAVLGRINYGNRFARTGLQGEVEMYPVISKKLYAYTALSYGSDVTVFPRWRTGAAIYYNFAKSWEAEGGFRYLNFGESLWLGTAGISKYAGSWLFNIRSFFALHTPIDNQAFFAKAQRYLKNERDYVWLKVGSGVSPDEGRNIQLIASSRLVSKRVAAGAKISLNRSLQFSLMAGYARDEYRIKTFGNQYNGSAGLSCLF